MTSEVEARALELVAAQKRQVARWADHLFATLLLVQWIAAIGVAFWISPWAWEGDVSHLHFHVWTAIDLGAAIVSLPVSLAWLRPARPSTRYAVAVGQMLMGSLIIHLSGGRIETHFHIFGSLALLAFYRDWKVLIVGSAVVVADHLLRSMLWPRSIFGLDWVSPWRWAEHTAWVVFEDIFLIRSCLYDVAEMHEIALRQAELEATRNRIELLVDARTAELSLASKALRLEKDRFRGAFDNAPIGMALVATDGRWLLVNRALCDILGRSEVQLLGMDFQSITHPDDLDFVMSFGKKLLNDEISSYQIEKCFLHGEGHSVWVTLSVSMVREESGKPLYFISQLQDITRRREIERDLECAKELAVNASRSKSEFLANMSHEVRTPMAAILGHSDMLLEPDLSQKERDQSLQAIRRNGSHLLQIINNILDLSKIEAGRLDLELIRYSPWQVALEVASAVRIRADERGITIDTRTVGRIPAFAIMDPTRVRQILMNLVTNAIKFSEEGGLVVVRIETPSPGRGRSAMLQIEVEDLGIGMTPAQIEQIFVPFQQADSSTTRKFGGTGLGLSITRRLAEIMGGSISVRSEIGRGSCFSVQIPVRTDEEESSWLESGALAIHVAPTTKLAGENRRLILTGRIMLAEDNPDNQTVLLYHLCRMGLDVEVVENGRLAVEKALQGTFDLVLMDMQMPELDGYGATSSLRRSGFQAPIIALTAHAMLEDREKCLRAGCTDFLTKPVEVGLLAEVLSKHLGSREATTQANGPGESPAAIVSEFQHDPGMSGLIRAFILELPDQVQRLRSLLIAGDLRELESRAHQMRGVGGMYGYPAVTEAAGLIEDAVREHQEPELLRDLIEGLLEIVDKMRRGPAISRQILTPHEVGELRGKDTRRPPLA